MLDRDPLKDIPNTNTIRYVMKNGELFDGDTFGSLLAGPEKAREAVLVGERPQGMTTDE